MNKIETMRVGDDIAIVVQGRCPYTICRLSKWQLVKLAFWSLFLTFVVGCNRTNYYPWKLDKTDSHIYYETTCPDYTECSVKEQDVRNSCDRNQFTLKKSEMRSTGRGDYYWVEVRCEK